MSKLADIHNDLSLRVCGLEGLAATMCAVGGDEGLISFFKVGVLLENELREMRSLVDRLKVSINERGREMQFNCGEEMSLSVRIVPEPYKYEFVCACGKSLPADKEKVRQSIQHAITRAVLCAMEERG